MSVLDRVPAPRLMRAVHQDALRRELRSIVTAPPRRRRLGRPGMVVSVSIGVTVAGGAGIAAASGAFSGPAAHALQQLAREGGPAQQSAMALQAEQARAAAEAATGKVPALPVPSTPSTTLPPPPDLGQKVFRVTDAGPNGTTISVWTERTGAETGCLVTVESATGQSADPGFKPPTPTGGGCSGGVGFPASVAYTYGMNAHIWVSPSGSMYMIVGGELSATATRVVFVLADGTTFAAHAAGGFFALGIPYTDYMSGGSVTAYSPNGTVLYQGPVE